MDNESLIPELRFNQYKKDWFQESFNDVFSSLQNNSLSRAELTDEKKDAFNIHYGDILIKFGNIISIKNDKLPSIIDNEIIDKYKSSFLKNGDIIIADTAEDETAGKCSEISDCDDEKVLSGLHTIPVRPKNRFGKKYLGYYMNSVSYHDQLLPLMQGVKVTSISKTSLKSTLIRYPSELSEQEQIGELLGNIDELIKMQQIKYNKLLNIKECLLSKMFPEKNSSIPSIRFKGYSSNWSEKRIGDFCEVLTGGEPPIDCIKGLESRSDYKFPILSNGIGENAYWGWSKEARINVPAITFSSIGSLGKPELRDAGFTPIIRLKVIIPNSSEVNLPYLKYNLDLADFSNNASGIPNINSEAVKSIIVKMSNESTEQEKIGNFLLNLDKLLILYDKKIKYLKNIKDSLSGKMFI